MLDFVFGLDIVLSLMLFALVVVLSTELSSRFSWAVVTLVYPNRELKRVG